MIQALSHRVNSLLQKNLSRSRYRIARRAPSHPQPTKMFALAVSRAQVTLNINGLTLVFLRRKVARWWISNSQSFSTRMTEP
jgi:hypothetical protein